MRLLEVVTETAYEYTGFWANFWDIIWWLLAFTVMVAYFFALFAIITDLFRDHKLSGWWKALWIIFLIFFPVLTALVYLIARGNGMARRSAEAAQAYQQETDSYIRSVAATSPSEEIAKAKKLLDEGAISQGEFDQLKAQALS